MRKPNPLQADRPALLVLCLSLSFLLHLLVILTLPLLRQATPNRFLTSQPTFVRLVDKPVTKPEPKKPLEYELDQKPPRTKETKPEHASRLAERNQRVKKEQAPKGRDERDQQPKLGARSLPAPAAETPPTPQKQQTTTKNNRGNKSRYSSKVEKIPAEPKGATKVAPPAAQSLPNLPSLQKLTELTPETLNRLAKEGSAARKKIKQRDDIEQGDTVWLNLQEGLLISFFRRFRNQIEGVWNYPVKAAEEGIQGVLLLKITVNRNGKLEDVDLLNSSGSDLLDFEAIQAVYRGAPFGPLPSQYPYPDLKIYAHFSYQLTSKYIYGQ